MEFNVQLKSAGKKENKIKTAKLVLNDNPKTVEDLIVFTVRATLTEFQSRGKKSEKLEEGDLRDIIIFDDAELMDKASSGKIGFGFLKGKIRVPEKKALETALQAFEDGIVAVFIDGVRYENLQDKLELKGGETLTFVKLAMLAGRMW